LDNSEYFLYLTRLILQGINPSQGFYVPREHSAGTCPTPVPRAEFNPMTTVHKQNGAAQPLTSLRRNVTHNNEMNNLTSMVM